MNEIQEISYAIGQQIGNDFKAQGIEICIDTFKDSVETAINGGESKLSEEEMMRVMQAFQTKMQAKMAEQSEHHRCMGGAELQKPHCAADELQ